jgi:hypothetical protein
VSSVEGKTGVTVTLSQEATEETESSKLFLFSPFAPVKTFERVEGRVSRERKPQFPALAFRSVKGLPLFRFSRRAHRA